MEKAFEGPQGWEGPGGLDGLEGWDRPEGPDGPEGSEAMIVGDGSPAVAPIVHYSEVVHGSVNRKQHNQC